MATRVYKQEEVGNVVIGDMDVVDVKKELLDFTRDAGQEIAKFISQAAPHDFNLVRALDHYLSIIALYEVNADLSDEDLGARLRGYIEEQIIMDINDNPLDPTLEWALWYMKRVSRMQRALRRKPELISDFLPSPSSKENMPEPPEALDTNGNE